MPAPTPQASLVWLFDVDGTLLLTQGAGREAMIAALEECFGIQDDLTGISFAGRTDPLILGDIVARHGLAFAGGDPAPYWDAVCMHMRRLMTPPRGGLLPGVAAALDAVQAEPAWVPALLTGNISEMARIKLAAFGMLERFAFGTFGEEGPDRNSLARTAVHRAVSRYGVPPMRCVVVGDTEHDVACARAAGAKAVAVATGSRTVAELRAYDPDLVLADLRDAVPLLEWARGL